MIRDEYKAQLKQTREGWEGWGSSAARNCDALVRYLDKHKAITDVLDFGCGTGQLGIHLRQHQDAGILRKNITIHEYDPSVPGKDTIPERTYDCIISLDVLEHVEPDSIAETMEWLLSKAPRQYHHIDCNETNDKLPDGRDVHLLVREPKWWESTVVKPGWVIVERHVHDKRKRGRFPRRSCTFVIERQG